MDKVTSRHPQLRPQHQHSVKLFSSLRSDNDDDDEQEEEYDEDSLFNLLTGGSRTGSSSSSGNDRQRRRDRIKNWISSEKKSMVRPISMDDGSIIEDEQQEDSNSSVRIKSNFDKFFAGMPSLQDILSSGDQDNAETSDATPSQTSEKTRRKSADDSWFAEEKQQIQQNYNNILDDMLQQLEEQRRIDPDSVPQNAQAIIKSVLKQEMDRETEERKSKRLEEMMEEYESLARNKADAVDISGPVVDRELQRLIEQSEAEYEQREASRLEVEEFLRYEQEAIRRSIQEEKDVIQKPNEGADLDAWALERLQDMARKREDEEGEEVVLDILEDNLEQLQRRMQQESKRGSLQPETMKEWQMYRSIASRLNAGNNEDESPSIKKEEETQIMARLESWKEYVELEEDIRKQSGLSRGPRLPFEWQETALETRKERDATTTNRSAIEVRREINRMSIQAMESLMEKSDPARREKLKREIDYLKETLESNNYLDIDIQEEDEDRKDVSPVDLTGVFQTFAEDEEPSPSESSVQLRDDFQSKTRDQDFLTPPPPPETPFFSTDMEKVKVSPPKTPFFDDGEPALYDSTSSSDDSKLGSFEDQKLQAMFRRSGVRSLQEQDEIRKQWEEFQQLEQEKRDIAGLSNDDDTGLLESFSAKYNVSDVMKDGDVDAEKILASIGPRPQRRKKQVSSPKDVPSETSPSKSLDEKEVVDSLYRSVAAAGGGRYKDDPDENERQKASYEEFVRLEREARQQLDEEKEDLDHLDDFITEKGDFDDIEYANEVLANLGPRPKPKRAKIIVDQGELSDLGGILADNDDDDEISEQEATDVVDESMPEWLRKENEEAASLSGRSRARRTFLGKDDIEEVFDDDEYEKNMRQLAEYENRRRTGKQRQMGIDISDVLGRTALESDDYADFKFDNDYFRGRQSNWGASSFESRKMNLLEYTELNVVELNSLMDLKDSVYATGVSQYTPRINKPFKEFGAIFRLEGVFLDITGFQLQAWSKVAKEHGFKLPDIDDVKRAAVTRPEVAVREVFFWTDDFLECRRAAETHRIAFREVFDAWREANNIPLPKPPTPKSEKGAIALGAEVLEGSSITNQKRQKYVPESERLEKSWQAWCKTADALGRTPPPRSQVVSAQTLSPDIAIKQLFQWSSDPLEVDWMAQIFLTYFQGGDTPNQVTTENHSSAQALASEAPSESITESDILELQYHIWGHLAETYGFEKPLPEEVTAAYAINDPEIAVRDGFGWTTDSEIVGNVVLDFNNAFQSLLHEISNGQLGQSSPSSQDTAPQLVQNQETAQPDSELLPVGLEENEIWDLIKSAWADTASAYGVPVPSTEQITLAQKVDPRDAVRKIFRWTSSDLEIETIASSFESRLRDSSNRLTSQYTLAAEPLVSRPVVNKKSGPTQDDIFKAVLDAWTAIARKSGFPDPDLEQVQFALTVGPEEAVINGFEWTSNATEVQALIADYKAEIAVKRAAWQSDYELQQTSIDKDEGEEVTMFKLIPGTVDWVKSLLGVEMQCGIVSYLERYQVDILMKETGLDNLVPPEKRVTASNGYRIDSQQLLGAALRLDRRPNHCVIFDSSPYSSAAAHDVEMQSVCVIGPYPRYELLSADSTTNSFEDMTAMNIRRLFGERVYDQPMLDMQQVDPQKMRKRKTKFFWEGDDY